MWRTVAWMVVVFAAWGAVLVGVVGSGHHAPWVEPIVAVAAGWTLIGLGLLLPNRDTERPDEGHDETPQDRASG